MRALVTGGGGFVGRHLVDALLADGQHVRAVDLDVSGLATVADHPRLDSRRGDITDRALVADIVRDVDVVYHLASAHLDVTLSPATYHAVNVDATRALAACAHAAGARRFVHCSTNGVVGHIAHPPVAETSPCRPTNIYEETKLLGEQAVLAVGQATGLAVVVARPAWVYGPGCPRTARLFRAVRKGRFIMFGDGRTLRHPIYVADAVDGLRLCAAASVAGEVFFLAGERAVTLNELLGEIAAAQGARPPRWRLPLVLGVVAGHALEWAFKPLKRPPPISRRSLDFFIKDNAYDIGKARERLGFAPAVDLTEGLSRTHSVLRRTA